MYHTETIINYYKFFIMKGLRFPLDFVFKISTLSNDFTAKDVEGQTVAYVRQKMFKLKEAITVYSNETKEQINYKIQADKWLDFSTSYAFTNSEGIEIGKVARKGWRSIWKASYEIIDQNQQLQYHVNEENPWAKVFDSMLGEIPIISMFTGYMFNPSYIVTDLKGEQILRIKKEASFFGRRFKLTKLKEFDEDDAERLMLGLMMMILLERRRG